MSNLIVVKTNSLIEASYKLSIDEIRILALTIGTMNPNSNQQIFDFTVADFLREFPEISQENAYKQIQAAIKRIYERSVKTEDNERVTEFRWVSSRTYFKKEGRFRIALTNEVMPYLTQLKGQFTQYQLRNISNFNSVHAVRIYELITQYRNLNYREISVEKLKECLQVSDKYPRFNSFNQRVLEPAVKEINEKSDLLVEIEQIKRGRTVHALNFIIQEKRPLKEKQPEKPKNKFPIDLFNEFSDIERETIQAEITAHITRLEAKGEIVRDFHRQNITKKAISERWGLDLLAEKQKKAQTDKERKAKELAKQQAEQQQKEKINQELKKKNDEIATKFESLTKEQQELVLDFVAKKIPLVMKDVFKRARQENKAHLHPMLVSYFFDFLGNLD